MIASGVLAALRASASQGERSGFVVIELHVQAELSARNKTAPSIAVKVSNAPPHATVIPASHAWRGAVS